jgi:hypothetical protein
MSPPPRTWWRRALGPSVCDESSSPARITSSRRSGETLRGGDLRERDRTDRVGTKGDGPVITRTTKISDLQDVQNPYGLKTTMSRDLVGFGHAEPRANASLFGRDSSTARCGHHSATFAPSLNVTAFAPAAMQVASDLKMACVANVVPKVGVEPTRPEGHGF